MSDRSWTAHFRKTASKWAVTAIARKRGLRKRHGLQGPIDDAFMDSFIFVPPTGTPLRAGSRRSGWRPREQHAIDEWRRQFRGDAQVQDDSASPTPTSRPATWSSGATRQQQGAGADRRQAAGEVDGKAFAVGASKSYAAATHAPILIYPNPLNPKRTSCSTAASRSASTTTSTTPGRCRRLPDYAVVDMTTPPGRRWPGKVAAAGFFGEKWELIR